MPVPGRLAGPFLRRGGRATVA